MLASREKNGMESEKKEIVGHEVGRRDEPAVPVTDALGEKRSLEVDGRIALRPWAEVNGMNFGATENRDVVESYRHIKRPLIMNIEGDGRLPPHQANRIMVTSSLPGEGKTFTALNLAISFAAERTKKVVFIDTDLVRSSLPEDIDVGEGAGLVDYLESRECPVGNIIQATDYENLYLIPAGCSHAYSTELLTGYRMRSLFDELESVIANDVVIILDTPPLLAASDAAVLARFVGQIIVVVEAGNTTRSHLQQAMSMIDHGKIAGYVLNKDEHSGRRGVDYLRYSA